MLEVFSRLNDSMSVCVCVSTYLLKQGEAIAQKNPSQMSSNHIQICTHPWHLLSDDIPVKFTIVLSGEKSLGNDFLRDGVTQSHLP